MARFKTRSEGSWIDSTDVTCSEVAQRMLNAAFASIRRKVDGCSLSGLDGLRERMRDMLDCSLEVECGSDRCDDLDGRTPSRGEARIVIFCPEDETQMRLEAIVFHEMIHAAGGTELDAEALENHCYSGNGATSPGGTDWDKFEDDGGEFVIWDEDTGELFVKIETGGSWIESPTVTRGDKLTPIFTKPAGSGGGSWI